MPKTFSAINPLFSYPSHPSWLSVNGPSSSIPTWDWRTSLRNSGHQILCLLSWQDQYKMQSFCSVRMIRIETQMNYCVSLIAESHHEKLVSNTLEEDPRYNFLEALHHVLKHPFVLSVNAWVEVRSCACQQGAIVQLCTHQYCSSAIVHASKVQQCNCAMCMRQ